MCKMCWFWMVAVNPCFSGTFAKQVKRELFWNRMVRKTHSQHTLQKQLHQTQNYVSNMRSANRRDCFVIHVRQTAHNSCGQFGSKLKNRIRCTTPRANGWNWMNMLKNKFQVWSFDSADSQNMFVRFLPAWKKNTWFVPCNSVFNEGALPGNCHGSSNVRLLFFLYAVCFRPFLGLPAWSISTKNANSVRIETFDCCGRWWACPIWSREGNSAVAGVKCSNKTSKNHLFCSNKSDWTWLNYFVVDHNSQHVTTEHFIFQFMHGQQSMCKKMGCVPFLGAPCRKTSPWGAFCSWWSHNFSWSVDQVSVVAATWARYRIDSKSCGTSI